jgi:hypothetical protein
MRLFSNTHTKSKYFGTRVDSNIKLTKLSTRLTIISVKPEQNTQKNALFCRSHRECPNQHNNQLRAVGRHGNRAAKQLSALVEGEREQRDQRHSADQTGDLLRRLPLVALGDQLRQDRHQGDVQEAAGGEGNYPGGPLLYQTKKIIKRNEITGKMKFFIYIAFGRRPE